MFSALRLLGVPLAHFRFYVLDVTSKSIAASLATAVTLRRPVIDLSSAATRKEDVARRLCSRPPSTSG